MDILEVEASQYLLSEQLLNYLEDLSSALRVDVIEALSVEGKLFHRPVLPLDGRWALLPFFLAHALKAEADLVSTSGTALAMECVICATDLLDDVMDDDVTPLIERLGTARVLNAALALISLPQRILLSLPDRDPLSPLILRLLDAIQQALLLASAGQQRDLLAERRLACELSREECIEIAALKAGSLLGLACRLGALSAGMDEALAEQCAEMGHLLGIAAQLDNDAHDLSHLLQPMDECSQKSDLRRGKKTLPVVLAAHLLRERYMLEAEKIDETLREITSLISGEHTIYLAALRTGILTTWGISLLYRERARECFCSVVGTQPVAEALLQVLGFERSRVEIKDW